MLTLTFTAAQQGFFDRAKVKKAVDAGTRRVFAKFGAFVRQRAKTSMRKRKGSSPPGSPPHTHVGLLRKFVLFSYDPSRKSVVIGPTLLRTGPSVPRLLEAGGTVVRPGAGPGTAVQTLTYRPRPFMVPAFQVELAKLPALWQNSIR